MGTVLANQTKVSTYSTARSCFTSSLGVGEVGFDKGIAFGGPTWTNSEGNLPMGFAVMDASVSRATVSGSLSSPCMMIDKPGKFVFRWVVRPGHRTISIQVKQQANENPRPTMVVKANSTIGITSDLPATASSGTDWVTIGPISMSATAMGVAQVEVRNNLGKWETPAFFDRIITT